MPGPDRLLTASIPLEFGIGPRPKECNSGSAKLEESTSEMSPCDTFRPHCYEASSMDPFVLASIQLLLGQTKKHASKCKRAKNSGKGSLDGKRYQGSKRKGRRALTYLKPGALAQLRDAQRSARSACCAKKKITSTDEEKDGLEPSFAGRGDAAGQPSMPNEATPGPSVRVFGPVCPQRKKLLAPKTPANSVTGSHTPTHVAAEPPSESRLESLPSELLVRIICSLHHDQLKPAFHVCKRLRQAVLVARQCHFDFTTPNRDRQEAVSLSTPRPEQNWPFMRGNEAVGGPSTRPPTPQAPRPPPKPAQARISMAEMKLLAAPLFQNSAGRLRRTKPPAVPRFAVRAAASHRVLFYEEELCQAVAQNSI